MTSLSNARKDSNILEDVETISIDKMTLINIRNEVLKEHFMITVKADAQLDFSKG